MDMQKNKNGFSIVSEEVSFSFISSFTPTEKDSMLELKIVGDAPVPEIQSGDRLLLPIDEGLALTADRSYDPRQYTVDRVGGNFCSREGTMSMVIVERKGKFLLIALENGFDSSYAAFKDGPLYRLSITCHKECLVRYGIFSTLTEACRYYRNMKKQNLLPLTEKIKKTPEIEKLIGGGIFWIWNNHYDKVMYADTNTDLSPAVGEELLNVTEELYQGGVDKAMIGIFFEVDSPLTEVLYKKYGYISTQYDNYNDVMNPELLKVIPNNRAKNCDYTARRMNDYPDGVLINKDGEFAPAWKIKGFDGKMHAQHLLCPAVANLRIREEIPKILENFPYYKARFLDVFGGFISECNSKEHPISRKECVATKAEALSFMRDLGLITGTEDGFEDILNELVYSEGMHSPVNLRNYDSGRRYAYIYNDEERAHLKKNMLNPDCRVPLWHLVYHDCLITFPYWGDSTACSPEDIQKKILFSCLYGCPPLYSFFVKDFDAQKELILESYKKISAVHKKVATLPMTDFRILKEDYSVQQTCFGDKYRITVNFSNEEYSFCDKKIAPMDLLVDEII